MSQTSTCVHCRREIWLSSSGDWYHRRNASTACYPHGGRHGTKATPR